VGEMKIGCFVTLFPAMNFESENNAYYGSARSAYSMAINLALKGIDMVIFSTSSDSKDFKEEYGGVIVHRYATNIKVLSTNVSFGMFWKPLKQDVDIVNVNFDIPPGPFAGLFYSKIKKVPLVVNYRGDWGENYGGLFRKLAVSFCNKYLVDKLLCQADVIISPSERYIDKSRFLGKYRDKIVVIPNGINIDEFYIDYSKKKCREMLNLSLDDKIILFVGTLGPHKGPDVLLKAMPMVVKSTPNTKLVFVGDGVMRNELETLSEKLGVKKDIKFVGYIGDITKKAMYYKSSDIFVLPTTGGHEIFGNVNLEAMACSIPIVASEIGGVPDVVKDGENGLLVPPRDSKALADAIIYLLENEDVRKEMGKNGKNKVVNYSWERIAEETENIYRRLV
jgi:glycosyltransferase involved in cell wall biosynthesis